MKLSIADLMEDCSVEDLMVKTVDPELTARVKKRVLAQIGVEEEKRIPTRSRAGARTRRIFTLALAAALLLSLGLVAYAVSSIHTARQQELRSDLSIDENHIGSYVEYEVPEDSTDGLVLLSAINDGEFQKVYVNVSPVTEDQLSRFPETWHFAWKLEGSRINGEEWWGTASPRLSPGRSVSGHEEILAAILEDAYDVETQTLTLCCEVSDSMIREVQESSGNQSVVLTVSAWDSAAMAEAGVGQVAEWINGQPSFGSVSFSPTEQEFVVFDLGNYRYHDEESGRELELVSLDLSPTGAVVRLRYDGVEEIYAKRDQGELITWGNVETRAIQTIAVEFSDGSALTIPGFLADPFENGTVNCYLGWEQTIDLHNVQRITLGDAILWESSGA